MLSTFCSATLPHCCAILSASCTQHTFPSRQSRASQKKMTLNGKQRIPIFNEFKCFRLTYWSVFGFFSVVDFFAGSVNSKECLIRKCFRLLHLLFAILLALEMRLLVVVVFANDSWRPLDLCNLMFNREKHSL